MFIFKGRSIALGLIFSIFTFLCICSPLLAQTDTQVKNPAVEEIASEAAVKEKIPKFPQKLREFITEEEFKFEVDTYAMYMPSREVRHQSGKVELVDTATEYNYAFKAFGELPLELFLEQRYVNIQNTTAVKLPAHLVGLSTGIEATLPFFNLDKTYLRLGVYPGYYADSWVFHSSAFRMPLVTFLIYQPNEQWTFIGGVGVTPDYETVVWPIGGFIYKPNDKLSFNIVPQESNITYRLNDKITLFGEGDINYNEFEVKKDDLRDVILKYSEIHCGGGLTFQINQYLKSSFSVGGVFKRTLQYRDSWGKVGLKNGLYTEFRVDISI